MARWTFVCSLDRRGLQRRHVLWYVFVSSIMRWHMQKHAQGPACVAICTRRIPAMLFAAISCRRCMKGLQINRLTHRWSCKRRGKIRVVVCREAGMRHAVFCHPDAVAGAS